MAKIVTSEGTRRDWPMIEAAQVASAAAGSGADLSTLICHLPDLSLGDLPLNLNQGVISSLGTNRSRIRQVSWVNNAANRPGGATNNYDWQLRLYRAGVLQGVLAYYTQSISTTVAAAVTAIGVQAATPAAMTGINPGQPLFIDSAGTPELVYVISTTATTFTANFTLTHSGAYTATSAALLNRPVVFVPAKAVNLGTSGTTITAGAARVVTPATLNGLNGMYGVHVGDWLYFQSGTGAAETVQVTATSATTFTASFANGHSGAYTYTTAGNPNSPGGPFGANAGSGDAFEIIGGDVLSLARVSNNATGLASDGGIVQLEWVPSKVAR
jgi:hypothetical protein